MINGMYDPRIPALGKQADDENQGIMALFNRSDAAQQAALRPTPVPQMGHPSAVLFGIAALLNALDRKGQPGGDLLSGYMQGAQQRNQQQIVQTQQDQQRQSGLAALYGQQAERAQGIRQKNAELSNRRIQDEREDDTKRYLGGLAYDKTIDKTNLDNANRLGIAQAREDTNRSKIAASLVNARSGTEAKWISVFGNPQQSPEMKAAAYSKLQKLNPEVYGDMTPDEVLKAIQASPAIQRLTEERIRTEGRKRANIDSMIGARATKAGLDAARTSLLKKELDHYDQTVADKAADIYSKIFYRDQLIAQGGQRIGIAQQSKSETNLRASKNSEIGTHKALAGLEQENIKAILKRHGGNVPEEDDDDYTNYMLSQQRLKHATDKLRELGRSFATTPQIMVPPPAYGAPTAKPFDPSQALGQAAPKGVSRISGTASDMPPKGNSSQMETDRSAGLRLLKQHPGKANAIRARFRKTYGVDLGG